MPTPKVSINKITKVIRLKAACLPLRTIASASKLSLGAVAKYVKAAQQAGLSWPADLSDDALHRLLVSICQPTTLHFCRSPTWSQQLPDWLGSHFRALTFFGRAPAIMVPDNLKIGVDRACRYDPEINRSHVEWATHFGIAVIPARPRKPQDKAKV